MPPPTRSCPGLATPGTATPGRRGRLGDITYRSDQFDFTSDGLMELSGNVDVHMGDREIMADKPDLRPQQQ